MSEVDTKIVEMRFDNRQFESNVKTTMSTIDNIKDKLKFTGAIKGLKNIDNAAKKIDMSGLSKAAETISKKFSALEVMSITALANITNSAVNAGKRIVSALTIDPIKTGFSEYETKINAIQTIMSNTSSKGKTMGDVTRILDELNTYADKTIYNFAEMTKNIGTFTAAGVGLEESAAAIQGIANLAASSGSTSQQASTAMYQLSQALSSGTVKLMDWNSVVNAGMGGQKFQDALKATAKEYDIDIDKIIEANGSFRDSLQEGWLSADILNTTLQKFTTKGAKEYAESMMESGKWTKEQADALIKESQAMEHAATKVKTFTQLWDTLKESAQSGWSQSWEIIIGNFEEAKELLTDVSDVMGGLIGAASDARNEVLAGWKDLGGRQHLIDSIKNAFKGVISVVKPLSEAFRDIFPPIKAEQLANFTNSIKNLSKHFVISEETAGKLKRSFKGLFALLDILKQGVSAVIKTALPFLVIIKTLLNYILTLTANLGDFVVKMNKSLKVSNIFGKAVINITNFIKNLLYYVKNLIDVLKENLVLPGLEFLQSVLTNIINKMRAIGESAAKMKDKVNDSFDSMSDSLEKNKLVQILNVVWTGIQKVVGGIASVLGRLVSKVGTAIANADFRIFFDIINGIISGGVGIAIIKFFKNLSSTLEGSLSGFKNVGKSIVGILDNVRGCFEAYQSNLKADTLKKISVVIAILAGAILVISLIDSTKLTKSLGAIAVLFGELMTAMAITSKITGRAVGMIKVATSMIAMSVAILILSSALKKIGSLKFEEMMTGLVGVASLTGMMVAVSKSMGKNSRTIIKGTIQMIIFAKAIDLLADSCKKLSELSWEELKKGLIGVGILLAEVSIFLNSVIKTNKSKLNSVGIVLIASAIKVLASACADFTKLDTRDIAKSLGAITVLLTQLGLFMRFSSKSKNIISTSIGLVILSGAIKILASALKSMASMGIDALIVSLLGIASALSIITAALNYMPENMIRTSIGLIGVATALFVISKAMTVFGKMSMREIGKSLLMFGSSMTILAIGLNAIKKTLGGSAALLVAAMAIGVLVPALLLLSKISWSGIGKGIATLASVLLILGVAGFTLAPVVSVILALAGAFALAGISIAAAGVGLIALATGFTALTVAVSTGATAIVASLTVIVTGMIGLIPIIIAKIGEGLIELCKVISKGAPAIGEAFISLILTAVEAMVTCGPAIVEGVLVLLDSLLAALVKYTPKIVDALFNFIIGILDGIAKNLPRLIKAAVNILMSFFSGVVDAIKAIDPKILMEGVLAIGLLSGIMLALAAVAAVIPAAMLGVLGMGVIIAELALILAAIGAISKIPGLKWLINEGGKLMYNVGTAIGSFIGGIVGGFMGGVSSQFPKIATDLSLFMDNLKPFIEGASNINENSLGGIKALAETILILTATNVINGLTSWFTGGSSMQKFGQELAEFAPYFKRYYDSIKGIDGSVVESSSNAAKALAEFAEAIPTKGGLKGWFSGESSLSEFAQELIPFGESLKKYASNIAGLDSNVVINSANAATAIAQMANALPKHGGIVNWFTGDNSLTDFANELQTFGPALKTYATSVSGLDPNVVTNSINAAKTLSEFSANLPNSGGLVSFFAGDNNLSEFGNNLVVFGKSFSEYSNYVKNVDSGIVVTTTNAAKALVSLVENLPKIKQLFSKEMPLSDFGEQIADFGEKFHGYYEEISDISVEKLSGVTTETRNLFSLVKDISGVNTEGLYTIGNALATLGKSSLEAIIPPLEELNANALNASKTMMTQFANGIAMNTASTTLIFSTFLNSLILTINFKQNSFYLAGQNAMVKMIAGIKSKELALIGAYIVLIRAALTKIRDEHEGFYKAGKYLVEGFCDGITEHTFLAEARAREMARKALEAAKKELDEHSPSKEGYTIGRYLSMGFANGISSYADDVYKTSMEMAKTSKDGLYTAIAKTLASIDTDMEVNPTIAPVLDLTDVRKEAGKLNSMLSFNRAVSIKKNLDGDIQEIQNRKFTEPQSGDITFIQNNNSPKALATIEIYRQTKNQISTIKRLVKP